MIRAVAFDLDNTLWEVDPVIARAEARWLEWLRENCPRIPERLSVEDLRASRMALAAREPHNAHDFTYLRIASLAQHARELGYDERISEQAFEIFIAERNQLDLYPDVRPGLARLSTRYALASLSNGNADLDRIGLRRHFRHCISARDVGYAKPHAAIFEAACAKLGVAPARVLHVGDDPLLDVGGARDAGLRTAWLNRGGAAWSHGPSPDLTIADLNELAAWILARAA